MAPPPDIAFLLSHGVTFHDLMRASEAARHWNTSADQALIALGVMSDEEFYRALADHLGVPFTPAGARAAGYVPLEEALRVGAIQVENAGPGRRFALAPTGEGLRRLIERPGAMLPSITITTPRRFRALAREADPARVAARAANDLPESMPFHSAKMGITSGQMLTLVALAGILVALVSWQAYDAILAALVVATVPFMGVVILRLAAVLSHFGTTTPLAHAFTLRAAELPTYTVLVALHRETDILTQTMRAIRAIDYPPAKLDVKFLLEEDDRETRDALARFDLPPFAEIIIVPEGQPRTKPRALNAGLVEARGELLVVFDAEDVPDPLQLRLAAAAFRAHGPSVACLQARLVIDNGGDSWLAEMFAVEYAQLFDVLNPLLANLDLPVPLGGTSTHFRTPLLRQLGGWDAWNVTEDADLGLRLAALGYRTADLPSATVEEAPSTLRPWLSQRTRWFKGWIQVSITFSRRPIRTMRAMGLRRWFWGMNLIFGTVASALCFPILTLGALISAAAMPLGGYGALGTGVMALSAVLFAAGFVAILLPGREGIKRRRLEIGNRRLMLLPLYYALMSVAAWRAVVELIRAPTQWNKTPHGLARTSRTGALTIAQANPVRPPRADA